MQSPVDVHPAGRGHPRPLPEQGARSGRDGAAAGGPGVSLPRRLRRRMPSRRRTSVCCWTPCRATPALFMRNDEIERAWAIMDPLIAASSGRTHRCGNTRPARKGRRAPTSFWPAAAASGCRCAIPRSDRPLAASREAASGPLFRRQGLLDGVPQFVHAKRLADESERRRGAAAPEPARRAAGRCRAGPARPAGAAADAGTWPRRPRAASSNRG